MYVAVSTQIIQAASVFLAGIVLGFVYHLFSLVRRKSGVIAGFFCDFLFCVIAAFSLFLLGMGPGQGDLRLYMPAVEFIGAASYFAFFSSLTEAPIQRFITMIGQIAFIAIKLAKFMNKNVLKLNIFLKNIFSRMKKRFTITGKIHGSIKSSTDALEHTAEEIRHETQKSKYIY